MVAVDAQQSIMDRLIDEFGDRIDRDSIARVVREEVLFLHRAKVRDFVPIIAWRLARQRLAEASNDLARDHLTEGGTS